MENAAKEAKNVVLYFNYYIISTMKGIWEGNYKLIIA